MLGGSLLYVSVGLNYGINEVYDELIDFINKDKICVCIFWIVNICLEMKDEFNLRDIY